MSAKPKAWVVSNPVNPSFLEYGRQKAAIMFAGVAEHALYVYIYIYIYMYIEIYVYVYVYVYVYIYIYIYVCVYREREREIERERWSRACATACTLRMLTVYEQSLAQTVPNTGTNEHIHISSQATHYNTVKCNDRTCMYAY